MTITIQVAGRPYVTSWERVKPANTTTTTTIAITTHSRTDATCHAYTTRSTSPHTRTHTAIRATPTNLTPLLPTPSPFYHTTQQLFPDTHTRAPLLPLPTTPYLSYLCLVQRHSFTYSTSFPTTPSLSISPHTYSSHTSTSPLSTNPTSHLTQSSTPSAAHSSPPLPTSPQPHPQPPVPPNLPTRAQQPG
ncbi:hypothetical protein Pcinc_009533 [Petrolisthes cinctipes]|uniref:Uncharacterized protein n=1 Tax=Petrolisthes cinctipes TaxID=88211 RepID=A0AAE1KVG2_PETCI|nr:hypothetical protein Pcinc_009533 [Petrolisthes cinctipes]